MDEMRIFLGAAIPRQTPSRTCITELQECAPLTPAGWVARFSQTSCSLADIGKGRLRAEQPNVPGLARE
eukprot:364256-Chlamydomonas_euryale.AAC.4